MGFIDAFLSKITMYRLIAYFLLILIGVATIFSTFGVLSYNPVYLLASTAFLLGTSWLSNRFFAYLWDVPSNSESSTITALILALIITPASPATSFWFLFWAALLATASKYILNVSGKHVFNPAGIAVAITLMTIHQSATWWVGGSLAMLPVVLVGGLLIVRKIHRFDLVISFILAALLSATALSSNPSLAIPQTMLLQTPLLFFAFVMITEPLTMPPRRWARMIYGAFVGLLFAPQIHIGSVYFTPEIALIVGNVLSFVLSPLFKGVITLQKINKLGTDTYEFVFKGTFPRFEPGQYAEWTVPAASTDSRGNRRWFTLASSPTEQGIIRLGVKFYPKPSEFKKILAQYKPGDTLLLGGLGGDFTLPRNKKRKVAFIAGGIGITPFRSMVGFMLDTNDQRDAVLLYANKTEGEISYRDIFDKASKELPHFRALYTVTGETIPTDWQGLRGPLTSSVISHEVPDFLERTFYISGPRGMVDAYVSTLHSMGVSRFNIKTDFFPGFA